MGGVGCGEFSCALSVLGESHLGLAGSLMSLDVHDESHLGLMAGIRDFEVTDLWSLFASSLT